MSAAAGLAPDGLPAPRPGATPLERLPALREDLRIAPAAPGADGAPAWTIHDPAAHRFFRIGWLEFELLSRWREGGTAEGLLARLRAETPLRLRTDQLAALTTFLRTQQLLRADSPADTARLVKVAEAGRSSTLTWL
ncbi:MAG: hypothetical protein ACOYLX_21130, partial [Burkholderiaceae bacterium]